MEHVLPYLLFLVCPISMGAMMWYMMRGQHSGPRGEADRPDARIARLEREIEELRSAHQDQEEPPQVESAS